MVTGNRQASQTRSAPATMPKTMMNASPPTRFQYGLTRQLTALVAGSFAGYKDVRC